MSSDDYPELVKALDKLVLNDASLTFEKDSSAALGHGFRCGFLGLLHLEVVQERLRREYDLSLLLSAPSVRYRVLLRNGEKVWVDNPSFYPDPTFIDGAEEPFIKGAVLIPERYIGTVMELCRERRGTNVTFNSQCDRASSQLALLNGASAKPTDLGDSPRYLARWIKLVRDDRPDAVL